MSVFCVTDGWSANVVASGNEIYVDETLKRSLKFHDFIEQT